VQWLIETRTPSKYERTGHACSIAFLFDWPLSTERASRYCQLDDHIGLRGIIRA